MNVNSSENTFRGTANEIATKLGIEYPVAQGLIKFLEAKGLAKKVDERKPAGGRGKPAKVVAIPVNLNFDFSSLVTDEPVQEQPVQAQEQEPVQTVQNETAEAA